MTATVLVRGSINIDEFYAVKNIARPGQTISARSLTKRLGGKGANQAVAAARAGAQVLLDGAVGADEEGISVKAQLSKDVLPDRIRIVEGVSTGKAIIQLADDGENSIIILGGANTAPAAAPSPLVPDGITHLLLANEVELSSTVQYLASAPLSVTTIFNPSPMLSRADLIEFPFSRLDWLLVNEGELVDISQTLIGSELSGDTSSRSPLEVAQLLFTTTFHSKTSIIVTLGAEGVVFIRVSESPASLTGSRPAAKLCNPLKDTTGAGDCFMGFFAAGLSELAQRGKTSSVHISEVEFNELLDVALTACAICVENEGAQDSYRPLSEVKDRLETNI
ncbi:ATP binding protein [Flagelloscypha sp. PMI_526]|nr:ATP binding protein [Flagelloscypha sp. PMI_526]